MTGYNQWRLTSEMTNTNIYGYRGYKNLTEIEKNKRKQEMFDGVSRRNQGELNTSADNDDVWQVVVCMSEQ